MFLMNLLKNIKSLIKFLYSVQRWHYPVFKFAANVLLLISGGLWEAGKPLFSEPSKLRRTVDSSFKGNKCEVPHFVSKLWSLSCCRWHITRVLMQHPVSWVHFYLCICVFVCLNFCAGMPLTHDTSADAPSSLSSAIGNNIAAQLCNRVCLSTDSKTAFS